ncbi:MAG: hypothetical protein QM800_14270 [Paludibacter sp.]
MSEAEAFFDQLCFEIPDIKPGKMFGAKCMKTPSGKSGAMFWEDCIVVKLIEPAFSEALNLSGTKQFEPMQGRPMKQWVQIPFTYKNRWKEFILDSIKLAG